jgi:antitoxin component of RelBE/YafQ-DinJ toxin-antitoxin module
MKPGLLVVDLGEELKSNTQKRAKEAGISMSRYVRNVLATATGTILKPQDSNIGKRAKMVSSIEEDVKKQFEALAQKKKVPMSVYLASLVRQEVQKNAAEEFPPAEEETPPAEEPLSAEDDHPPSE